MSSYPYYKAAVEWIAWNDEPTLTEPDEIAMQLTVLLVADIFGADPETVAKDVVKVREAEFDVKS